MFKYKQDPTELIDLIPLVWLIQYLVVPLAVWSLDSLLRRRSLITWVTMPFIAAFRYLCLVGGIAVIGYTVLTNSWVRPHWENTLGKEIMGQNKDMDIRAIAGTLSIFGAASATMAWVIVLFLKDVGYLLRGILFRGYKQKTA
jgi:hypothetical protein